MAGFVFAILLYFISVLFSCEGTSHCCHGIGRNCSINTYNFEGINFAGVVIFGRCLKYAGYTYSISWCI